MPSPHLRLHIKSLAKDLYTENDKPLLKEIEEGTNRGKDIPCSCIGRLSVVEISILPQMIFRFNAILVKISITFFIEILKIYNSYGITKDHK